MLVTESGIVILVKDKQPDKASLFIDTTKFGIVKFVKLMQFFIKPELIYVKDEDNVMFVKLEHDSNAFAPRNVTELGTINSVNVMHSLNALSPNDVTDDGIDTLVKLAD